MNPAVRTEPTMERLRELLARDGEALAPALTPGGKEVMAPLVMAASARHGDTPAELALVTESVLEGYLLHYGRARLVETADVDLRLLAGDHMYAVGLSRLARLGDLGAVRALADLITLCARLHAEAESNGVDVATGAGALWVLTALAVAGGRWPAYEEAIDAVLGGKAEAVTVLATAHERAAALGVALEAQAALIAFETAARAAPTPSNSGNFSL